MAKSHHEGYRVRFSKYSASRTARVGFLIIDGSYLVSGGGGGGDGF